MGSTSTLPFATERPSSFLAWFQNLACLHLLKTNLARRDDNQAMVSTFAESFVAAAVNF